MFCVGIVGAGGIGSNVAWMLIRSQRIKNIIIADFDEIEYSNLNRQWYFHNDIGSIKAHNCKRKLENIYQDISIKALHKRITRENFKDLFHPCDLVVDATDHIETKKMLLEQNEKIILSCNGIAGESMENIKVRKCGKHYLIGDQTSSCHKDVLYTPKIISVASLMAHHVLQFQKEKENEKND